MPVPLPGSVPLADVSATDSCKMSLSHQNLCYEGCPCCCDMCREMIAQPESRVDFAMAEALALGTLALHRSAKAKRTATRDSSQHQDASLHDFPEVTDPLPDAARAGALHPASCWLFLVIT